MSTRIIGIDLAVTAAHKAAILDPATNRYVVKQMTFRTSPAELDKLLRRARHGAGDNPEIIVVLEATSLAWHPVSLYLQQHGAKLYRVNGRMTKRMQHALPTCPQRRLDCQVLARVNAYPATRPALHSHWRGDDAARACREFVRYREASPPLTSPHGLRKLGLAQAPRLIPARAPTGCARVVQPMGRDRRRYRNATQRLAPAAGQQERRLCLAPALVAAGRSLEPTPPITGGHRLSCTGFQHETCACAEACLARNKMTSQDRHRTALSTSLPQPWPASLWRRRASAAIYMAFIHSIDRFPPSIASASGPAWSPPPTERQHAVQRSRHHSGQPQHRQGDALPRCPCRSPLRPQLAAIYPEQMVLTQALYPGHLRCRLAPGQSTSVPFSRRTELMNYAISTESPFLPAMPEP